MLAPQRERGGTYPTIPLDSFGGHILPFEMVHQFVSHRLKYALELSTLLGLEIGRRNLGLDTLGFRKGIGIVCDDSRGDPDEGKFSSGDGLANRSVVVGRALLDRI